MKALAIVLTIILLPVFSVAENPDSRPSIYFGLEGATGDGHQEIAGITVQKADLGQYQLSGGLTWPVNENTTLFLSSGYTKTNTEWKESIYFIGQEFKSTGLSFGVGVKLYIGKSINK